MKRFLIVLVILVLLISGAIVGWNSFLGSHADVSLEASLESVNILPPVEHKPEAKTNSTATSTSDAPENPTNTVSEESPKPPIEQVIDHGTLTIEARDQRFAEEAYKLRQLPDGTYQLISQGKIKFKLILIDAELRYTQAMQWDSKLRPESFALDMKGPAGFGNRQVQARVQESAVQITSDGKSTERFAPSQPFLLLAMFSSYSILSQWIKKTNSESFEIPVLTIRGPEERENKNRESNPPSTTALSLKKLDAVEIKDKKNPSKILLVQRYEAKSQSFSSVVFVDGTRFIGLLSEPTDKSSDRKFYIYRSDLFPEGFLVKMP